MPRPNSKPSLPGNCPNCGRSLISSDRYCPSCGQKNTQLKIPFHSLVADFFRDYLAFDSKWFRSIIPLLFKPGKLPGEFVQGRRERYIPPARLYIFTSIIYFFVLGQWMWPHTSLSPGHTAKLKYEVNHVNNSIAQNAEKAEDGSFLKGVFDALNDRSADTALSDSIASYPPQDSLKTTTGNKIAPGNQGQQSIIAHAFKNLLDRPQFLKTKVLRNLSWMMLLMVPLFGLLLWLIYIRHKRYYIEHLVFAVHYHTFTFIAIILLWLIDQFVVPVPGRVYFLILFVYLLLALKRFYNQGYLKSALKSILLTFAYSFLLLVGLGLTFVLSIILT